VIVAALVATAVLVLGSAAWGITTAVRDHDKAAAAAKAKAAHARAVQKCRNQVGRFVGALRDIDSRLDVGMTQSDLSDATGDAATLANRIDESALAPNCASVFDLAKDALDAYAGTVSAWNDCIWDDDCDPDTDVDFSPWSDASHYLDEAYDALLSGRRAHALAARGTRG